MPDDAVFETGISLVDLFATIPLGGTLVVPGPPSPGRLALLSELVHLAQTDGRSVRVSGPDGEGTVRWALHKNAVTVAPSVRPVLLIADVTTPRETEEAMAAQGDATLVLNAPWLDANRQRFDAGLVLDAGLLDEGLLPPVSPTGSWSRLLVDPVVDAARAAFGAPRDRARLIEVLRQPFHVAATMTGIPGERRSLPASIAACRAALCQADGA
jgi:F0F1-type ATP synthase beta subunit